MLTKKCIVYLHTQAHFHWIIKLKNPFEKYNEQIQKAFTKTPITDPNSVLEETAL